MLVCLMTVANVPISAEKDEATVDDAELVQKAVAGDLDAYDELVRRYQSLITGLLYRFCPHRSELEDLVQETMIKAYRNLDKWKATASYSSWLKKIAINTGYDYFRKNQRQPVALAGREESDDILSNLTCQSEATQRGRVEEVQRLLSDLSAEDRLLLTLQYLEGLQLNEIAEKLNWGLSKAKVKSFRAKKKLQSKLSEYGITEI